MIEDTVNKFLNEQRVLAHSLIMEFTNNFLQEKGRDLSDKEKFAIVFNSGSEVKFSALKHDESGFKIDISTEVCDVIWDGFNFVIYKAEGEEK